MRRIVAGWIVLALGAVSPSAQAGAVVELVPDQPGPYFGGEWFTVDVWLNSDVDFDVLLALIQFDFSQTDPGLSLDSEFTFDFSSIPDDSGYQLFLFPELPVPWTAMTWDCVCPGLFLHLLSGESLHIGSIGVQLPIDPGVYGIDALNAEEPDEWLGAKIMTMTFPPLLPGPTWRAFTGEITGGARDFIVVPEPATVSFLLLGGLAILTRIPRRSTRSRRAEVGVVIAVVVSTSAFPIGNG